MFFLSGFFLATQKAIDMHRFNDCSKIVTASNGAWLRVYLNKDDKWRIKTTLELLPKTYLSLLVNYEDKNFYHHLGFDISAIIRAFIQNIKAGKIVSGASTISMQTIRLLEPRQRSFKNKIIEAFRAIKLEQTYTKSQILTIYTTLIPMGKNIEGLTAASFYYFKKPLAKLSVAETAWLIAMPQSPSKYNPITNPILAKKARNNVLKRAFENKIITTNTYKKASLEAIKLSTHLFPFIAPHFSNIVINQNKDKKNESIITTNIDYNLQLNLENLLHNELKSRDKHSNLAAAILDNSSGRYLAYVGSSDFFSKVRNGQINILNSIRSPGSTLKPFITLFAFSWLKYLPQTLIADTPFRAQSYNPRNYDGKYQGNISIANALIRSRNVPAVRLLKKINTYRFSRTLQEHQLRLYWPANARPNLALALGGVGIKGANLLRLYQKLANCSYNNIINPPILAKQKYCWQITKILQQSQDQYGRVFLKDEPIAFKTGTAYGWRDQWVFAYSKKYSLVIWGGRADGEFFGKQASSQAIIPILRKIVALLPKPTTNYHELKFKYQIHSDQLPTRIKALKPAKTDTFKIITPLNEASIEKGNLKNLTIKISGGTPPYLWILNEGFLAQSIKKNYQLNNLIIGSYNLTIIDANGLATTSSFRIVKELPKNNLKINSATFEFSNP